MAGFGPTIFMLPPLGTPCRPTHVTHMTLAAASLPDVLNVYTNLIKTCKDQMTDATEFSISASSSSFFFQGTEFFAPGLG